MKLSELTKLLASVKIPQSSLSNIVDRFSAVKIELDEVSDALADSIPQLLKDGKTAMVNDYIQNYNTLKKYIVDFERNIDAIANITTTNGRVTIEEILRPTEVVDEKDTLVQTINKKSANESNNDFKWVDFTRLQTQTSKCPDCRSNLLLQSSYFSVFTDSTKIYKQPKKQIATRYCPVCKILYLEDSGIKKIHDTIGFERTNVKILGVCMQPNCYDPIYRGGYCQFHYNYEHAASK